MLNLFVESSCHRLSVDSLWQLCPWAARGRKHRCGSCCPVCTHSDDVISSQKRLFVSFHNARWVRISVNIIKQHQCDYLTAFGDTFGFWLSCSARLLYTFTPQQDWIHFEQETTNEDRVLTVWPILKFDRLTHSLTLSATHTFLGLSASAVQPRKKPACVHGISHRTVCSAWASQWS